MVTARHVYILFVLLRYAFFAAVCYAGYPLIVFAWMILTNYLDSDVEAYRQRKDKWD